MLKGVVSSGCCPWGGVVLGMWSLWEVVVLGVVHPREPEKRAVCILLECFLVHSVISKLLLKSKLLKL